MSFLKAYPYIPRYRTTFKRLWANDTIAFNATSTHSHIFNSLLGQPYIISQSKLGSKRFQGEAVNFALMSKFLILSIAVLPKAMDFLT